MRLGLGLSLTSLRGSAGVPTFTIASLFSDASGLWGDNRDTSTLFQDTAGTTPVTTTGQTVALALNKSEGAGFSGGSFTGLGAELVTNGDGGSVTGWSGARGAETVTASGGRIRATSVDGSKFGIAQSLTDLTIGAYYAVSIEGFKSASGTILLRLQSSAMLSGTVSLAIETSAFETEFSGVVQATAETMYIGAIAVSMSASDFIEIDNVSVRELPGNHRTQSGISFRPRYQTGGLLYDGTDDRMDTPLTPTTSGTIAARFNGDTASRVILGSQAASDGRGFLALDASGRLGAGIGSQSTSTIFGGSDLRGAWHTGAVTWDGSTVKLYLDGEEVYSAAQSGAVNTTVPFLEGALNANGTAAAFWDGTISDTLVLDRVATPDEITNLHNEWSA